MLTVREINNIQIDYVRSHGGWHGITEGCWKLNTITRAKIRAFKRENDKCFLGNINPPMDGSNSILKEYKRGMVYNFGGNFIIPEYNEDLIKIIKKYRNGNDKHLSIITKIDELNGEFLNWV